MGPASSTLAAAATGLEEASMMVAAEEASREAHSRARLFKSNFSMRWLMKLELRIFASGVLPNTRTLAGTVDATSLAELLT